MCTGLHHAGGMIEGPGSNGKIPAAFKEIDGPIVEFSSIDLSTPRGPLQIGVQNCRLRGLACVSAATH